MNDEEIDRFIVYLVGEVEQKLEFIKKLLKERNNVNETKSPELDQNDETRKKHV